ncbi:MAG TPA: substrate-binding domain-containing protein [Microvirga sp.]|jgi:ribose transport system substrate-binding protein
MMSALVIGTLSQSLSGASAQQEGVTTPVVLPPFNENHAPCNAPPNREKSLVFAQDNQRQFMEGVSFGLASAARDRGLSYSVLLAANDANRALSQITSLHDRPVGGVVVAPVDSEAIGPHLRRLILNGVYVGTIVPPPAVTLLNAPQYRTGQLLGEAAVRHVRERLAGRANVVILSHDSLEFLAPRFVAMRDALRQVPGATIVADISPVTVDHQGGFDMMNTIMVANPRIDVVLGADTVVLGALAAMRAAGRVRPDQFFGGIDGEPEALVELRKPDSPYRTSISLSSPVFGYAMGQHAADWLEGKSIPQAMDILPRALTQETLAQYEEDGRNPGAVYRDQKKRSEYLALYGNICFETRDRFINFPWSSETR